MLRELTFDPVKHTTSTVSSRRPTYSIPVSETQYIMLVNQSLRTPLTLVAKRIEGGQWLVTRERILTHGVGDNVHDAVLDFQSMLIDYFKELVDSEDVLSPRLLKQLHYLREILAEENVL